MWLLCPFSNFKSSCFVMARVLTFSRLPISAGEMFLAHKSQSHKRRKVFSEFQFKVRSLNAMKLGQNLTRFFLSFRNRFLILIKTEARSIAGEKSTISPHSFPPKNEGSEVLRSDYSVVFQEDTSTIFPLHNREVTSKS